MANYRIQRLDGTIEGPLTSADLKDLAARGRISPADRVAPEGTDRWVPATRVNGIREILEARAISTETTEPEPAVDTIPLAYPAAAPTLPPRLIPDRRPTDAEPRQYGVLRCVAGWVILYGWLIVALGFTYSYFMTVLFGRQALGFETPWSEGFIAIMVLLAITAGIATAIAVRAFANQGGRLTSAFGAVILLPLIPYVIGAIREGAVNSLDGVLLLQVLGASLSALILGSVIVAVGEFLIAHADIATNSWFGRGEAGRRTP